MENVLRPKGVVILVSVFICLCLIGQSAATQPDTTDPLSRAREFHSDFIAHDQQLGQSLVIPNLYDNDTHGPGSKIFPIDLMHTVNQQMVMDNSHPEQHQNIDAPNANIQRTTVFDDTQSGDPMNESLRNSMDIGINGNGQGQPEGNRGLTGSYDDIGIENFVDNAVTSQQQDDPEYYQNHNGSITKQRLGNFMNIDVSGINVRAINTISGGRAVATSNIEIKPVQIINCPPEVEEKLK